VTEAGAWQVLRAETLLDQPPWLSVIRQAVRLPGGAVLDGYYLTPGRDYSMVVALTEEDAQAGLDPQLEKAVELLSAEISGN